jgi:hypothetical protein
MSRNKTEKTTTSVLSPLIKSLSVMPLPLVTQWQSLRQYDTLPIIVFQRNQYKKGSEVSGDACSQN